MSGHDFSRAEKNRNTKGFSVCVKTPEVPVERGVLVKIFRPDGGLGMLPHSYCVTATTSSIRPTTLPLIDSA